MEDSDAADGTRARLVAGERIQDVSAGRRHALRGRRTRLEQRARFDELRVDVAGSEQAEVAHLDEARGQDEKQEAAKKFDRREGEGLAVLGAECDGVVAERDEPAVGDPDTMRITP